MSEPARHVHIVDDQAQGIDRCRGLGRRQRDKFDACPVDRGDQEKPAIAVGETAHPGQFREKTLHHGFRLAPVRGFREIGKLQARSIENTQGCPGTLAACLYGN